jgi:hypothetical protein
MEMSLCERFTAMTPLSLRKEKAREVFILISRYNNYSKKNGNNGDQKPKIIRRPASDTWF